MAAQGAESGITAAAQDSAAATVPVHALPEHELGGEVNLRLPSLEQGDFLGLNGRQLLLWGLTVCVFGLLFGLATYLQVKKLPVHEAMLEVSEMVYETCKTYLLQQGKLLLVLELFIGTIIVLYFLMIGFALHKIGIILLFSLIGMAGSYSVAWYGHRINTLANSRTAFASLRGRAFPVYETPIHAGMSVGTMLVSVELLFMLAILLFIPGDYAGPCFLGFAIGESLGAAALRIAGGIFTKIADIGSDLMKIIKGTELHAATVVGDTVGDPFKDTSSVAMNPVIKFTTLFGLLAVELGVYLSVQRSSLVSDLLSLAFFAIGVTFVWRSFYAMRIQTAHS